MLGVRFRVAVKRFDEKPDKECREKTDEKKQWKQDKEESGERKGRREGVIKIINGCRL